MKIVKIEKSDEEKIVYDLWVPDGNEYVANGIASHNSAMANQLLINMASRGHDTVIVPLEMTDEECSSRVLANLAGVNVTKFLLRKVTAKEKQQVTTAYRDWVVKLKELDTRYTIYDPEEDVTIEDVLFMLKPYNYKVILIDYISLLKGVDGDDQWRQLSAVARFAKVFAKTHRVVVVLLVQVSDEGAIRYSRAVGEHCVTGDTLVHIDNKLEKVGALARRLLPTREGINFNGQIATATGYRDVEKFYCFGRKPVRRISLETGNSIGVSSTTPVLVLKDTTLAWVAASDLKVGDLLLQSTKDLTVKDATDGTQPTASLLPLNIKPCPVKHKTFAYRIPRVLTKDLARICGYLAAEGYLKQENHSYVILMCNGNPKIMEDFVVRFNRLFGTTLHYSYNKHASAYYAGLSSKRIYSFFKAFGISGNSHTKRVPVRILKSTWDIQREFLVGLFQGDGDKQLNVTPRFNISLYNPDLLKDVQVIFNNKGCISKLVVNSTQVSGNLRVSATSVKPGALNDLCRGLMKLDSSKWSFILNTEAHNTNNTYGVVPNFWTHMRKYKKGTKNCMYTEKGERLPYGLGISLFGAGSSKHLPISKIHKHNKFIEVLHDYYPDIHRMVKIVKKYDLQPVRISSIMSTEEEVYDFTVAQTSEPIIGEGHFFANNLVVHNSNNCWLWTYSDENRESGIIEVRQFKARNQEAFPFQLAVDFATMRFRDVRSGEASAMRTDSGDKVRKSLDDMEDYLSDIGEDDE